MLSGLLYALLDQFPVAGAYRLAPARFMEFPIQVFVRRLRSGSAEGRHNRNPVRMGRYFGVSQFGKGRKQVPEGRDVV